MGVKLGLTLRKGRGLRMYENRVFKKDIWFESGSKRSWRIGKYREEAKYIKSFGGET